MKSLCLRRTWFLEISSSCWTSSSRSLNCSVSSTFAETLSSHCFCRATFSSANLVEIRIQRQKKLHVKSSVPCFPMEITGTQYAYLHHTFKYFTATVSITPKPTNLWVQSTPPRPTQHYKFRVYCVAVVFKLWTKTTAKSHLALCSSCCAVARARLSLSWLISAWPNSSSWSLEWARSQAAWCSSCSSALVLSACSARANSFCKRNSRSLTCSDKKAKNTFNQWQLIILP